MSAGIFAVVATLLIPHPSGKPLERELGTTHLRAESLERCNAVQAPWWAEQQAKAHAADVRSTGGRVVAACRPLAVSP